MTNFNFEALSKYGITSVIIVLISTTVWLIIDKINSKRLEKIKNYVALIISVILQIAFEMIFIKKEFALGEETLTTGIITGSFSTAVCVFIKKLRNKKAVIFNPTRLAIEGLLEGIVPEDDKEGVAVCIENTYHENNQNLSTIALSCEINNKIMDKFGFFIEEKIVLIILTEILKLQNKS